MSDRYPPRHRRIFTPMSRGAAQAAVALFLLALLLGAANLLFTARLVNEADLRAQALCRFDAHLGAVPVANNPATGKPSLLGVSLVSDARVAWRLAGCPGHLAPADPSFTRWAKAYGLPAG